MKILQEKRIEQLHKEDEEMTFSPKLNQNSIKLASMVNKIYNLY